MNNEQLFKDQRDNYKKQLLKILRLAIKELPREMLIEELKKKKIIKQDYLQKGEVYKKNE